MNDPRIILGIEEGRLTLSFIGPAIIGDSESLVSGLTPQSPNLAGRFLSRVADLPKDNGTVAVELPLEQFVRRVNANGLRAA